MRNRKLKKNTNAATKWMNLTVPNQYPNDASAPLLSAGGAPIRYPVTASARTAKALIQW